jgi:hypothetical protein
MIFFIVFFIVSFAFFRTRVFMMGFSLFYTRVLLACYTWLFISQWLGLIFFLVYVSGVIVIFVFFCSYIKGRRKNHFIFAFPFLYFFWVFGDSLRYSLKRDFRNLRESAQFYSITEITQVFLLGFWLVFVLWRAFKIINIVRGATRLI